MSFFFFYDMLFLSWVVFTCEITQSSLLLDSEFFLTI